MKKTKNTKQRALNGGKKDSCFFKAFFLSVAVTFAAMALLSLAAAAVFGKIQNSTGFMHIAPHIITALSLLVAGKAGAVMSKEHAIASAFMCGCAFLGISYALSAFLQLGGNMDALNKTLSVAIAFLCPLAGAKMTSGTRKKSGIPRKNVKL